MTLITNPFLSAAIVAARTSGSLPITGCRLARTSSLSLTTATGATITTWDSEAYDSDGYHDTVTNPERITIPAGLGGKYLIAATAHFSANATGRRTVTIKDDSVLTTIGRHSSAATSSGVASVSLTFITTLAAGAYLSMEVYQDSGSTLTLDNSTVASRASFSVTYLGA